jgi:hypothetical protein
MVVLDDEQHVEPAQENSVDVEEVDCGDGLGVGGQELLPTGGCTSWCGSVPAALRISQMVEGATLCPRPAVI